MSRYAILTLILLSLISNKATANPSRSNWYGIVGTGYAFSLKAGIHNPDPTFWDPSDQGYNASLGQSPFLFIGLGRKCSCFNIDATYSYYRTFHYQKYQSAPTPDPLPPGFTGNTRTRFFDLDHSNILFDVAFEPHWCGCSLNICGISILPIVGVGIGAGFHQLFNFHTVAFFEQEVLNPNQETVTIAVGTTSSIGEIVRTADFAWRVLAAVRFKFPCSCFAFDVGYRYYDGGRFTGPATTVANTADAQGTILTDFRRWKGRLRTNEVFISINLSY